VSVQDFARRLGLAIDRHLAANKTVTVTCFYEKATRRLRLCTVPQRLTMRFDRYDDPANRFTLPSAALHAPDAFRSLK
jgi:hypothetical protein